MKTKLLILISILVMLCSCSSNNVTKNDIVLQFVELTIVKGEFKQALELSTGFNEDELKKIYQKVDSGYRDSYKKVDIYVTNDDSDYLSYLPDYRILIELSLSKKKEMLVNNVTINHPSLEEIEKIWKDHNWNEKTIELNNNES